MTRSSMKLFHFRPLWVSAVTLSLMTLPLALPTIAQTTDPTAPDVVAVEEEDDGFDWGLLGLLGLLGLAGLARKRNDEPTHYRDPNVDPTTTTTRSDYNR
jgi:MYXO-CTERM domain-containing protein